MCIDTKSLSHRPHDACRNHRNVGNLERQAAGENNPPNWCQGIGKACRSLQTESIRIRTVQQLKAVKFFGDYYCKVILAAVTHVRLSLT